MAAVFPRGDQEAQDGGVVVGIEGEAAREGEGVAGPGDVVGVAERKQQALPAAVGGGGALVQHQVQVHIEQACGVLGALQLTGHPVEGIGDAG